MRILATLALAPVLLLGGCATFQDKVNQIDPAVQQVLSTVSKITRSLCGFEPIAATIVNVLSGGSTVVPFQVAEQICAAVSAQALAADPHRSHKVTVTVRGVKITGILHPKTR